VSFGIFVVREEGRVKSKIFVVFPILVRYRASLFQFVYQWRSDDGSLLLCGWPQEWQPKALPGLIIGIDFIVAGIFAKAARCNL